MVFSFFAGDQRSGARVRKCSDLTWAKENYHSVHGNIISDWKKGAGGFSLRVSIHASTTAEVWLPAKENSTITESGNSVNSIKNVKSKGYKNGYAVIETGSGDYYFLSRLSILY